ncbi:MAG: hypothetical protein KAS38_05935 [Anaerolineales bacterium]|nr:hypothetical protein [Anaerolineales bacterium]
MRRNIRIPIPDDPAMNTFGNQFSGLTISGILFIGLAIFAFVSDRMWEKLPSDHPAVYQAPGFSEKNVELHQR